MLTAIKFYELYSWRTKVCFFASLGLGWKSMVDSSDVDELSFAVLRPEHK